MFATVDINMNGWCCVSPSFHHAKLSITYSRYECCHLVLVVGSGAAVLCSYRCPIYLFIIKLKHAVLVRTLNNKEIMFGEKCISGVFWGFSFTHILHEIIEWAEFMTYTAVHHQGRSIFFGFTFPNLSCHLSLHAVSHLALLINISNRVSSDRLMVIC